MNKCKWIVWDNENGDEIITDNYEEALEVYEKCKDFQESLMLDNGEFTTEERVILAEIKKDFYSGFSHIDDEGQEIWDFKERDLEEENISEFADYLIENASCAFEHKDRELLEKVLRNYNKVKYESKREKEKQINSIPEKSRIWMKKGREVLDKSKWELWDRIVPIRLNDLYQGMELKCCLDIVEILNKGTFEDAKKELETQKHTEMSFELICSMIKDFSPKGEEFIDYLR